MILALSAACADADDDDAIDITDRIEGAGAVIASQYHLQRAAAGELFSEGPRCTATRVAPNWLLTAGHCNLGAGCSNAGCRMHFYGAGSNGMLSAFYTAQIAQAYRPPGVTADDDEDNNGDFADLQLLRLDRPDIFATNATLAWRFPGVGVAGYQVGAGQHDDSTNPNGVLRQQVDHISTDDEGGWFHTADDEVDPGDSGGPFYDNNRVVGVASIQGLGWTTYTSVPYHLPWILSTIGYRWSGGPSIAQRYTGTGIATYSNIASESVCQYACEATAACEAYNYGTAAHSCVLVDGVTGVEPWASTSAGLRYGGRRGSVEGYAAGYVRTDDVNAVAHWSAGSRIREIFSQSPSWSSGDIQAGGANPSSKVSPYRRSDGINAVVYRSGNQLIELALVGGTWVAGTLPTAGTPVGNPAAFERADGLTAIVYRTNTGRIVEVAFRGAAVAGGWQATDLTTAAAGPLASGDPSGYVRSDGYTSVLYRSGDHIVELFKAYGADWHAGDLSALAGAPAAAPGTPHGYVHHDGINAVVYRSAQNRVIEIWANGVGWSYGDITGTALPAAGDPFPYVRTDGIEVVVFRIGNQIWETANVAPFWTAANLSAWGGPTASGDPTAYLRSDGYNSVVFPTSNNSVGELTWAVGIDWAGWNLGA